MAKELAWKASKVLKPRGFESHALRQKIKEPPDIGIPMRKAVFYCSFFNYKSSNQAQFPTSAVGVAVGVFALLCISFIRFFALLYEVSVLCV